MQIAMAPHVVATPLLVKTRETRINTYMCRFIVHSSIQQIAADLTGQATTV